MTDEQLVEALLRQDAGAQRQLYERYSRRMFGVCMRYAKSQEEAEDLLQEGYLKVFQKISSYKNQGSLEGWIRRVIINTALDYLRRQKINWTGIEHMPEQAEAPPVLDHLHVKDLLQVIQQLPAGFRTVFNLYAIEGYTHKEIGELLGISENTSKSQYSRARANLIALLKSHTKNNSISTP